jgi:hypothetical protein
MTDRELLEAAAKAAGIELAEWTGDSPEETVPRRYWSPTIGNYWNTLEDDGDALRLAVKLELFDLDKLLVELDMHERAASHHLDPLAATRRAITRAAAEIGRARDGGEMG